MNNLRTMLLVFCIAASASSARAQQDATDGGAAARDTLADRTLTVGLKTGLYVPSIFNEMGVGFGLSLEVGVMLPPMDRRLAVVFAAAYAGPGADGRAEDPRVGPMGSAYDWEMTTSQLYFSLGPLFRFLPPGSPVNGYVGLEGRLYFYRTTVSGAYSGGAFGENTEESASFGFGATAGVEMRLGPGVVAGELAFGWAPLDHTITGETNGGALALLVGYRLMI